jgi:hypothetical protein
VLAGLPIGVSCTEAVFRSKEIVRIPLSSFGPFSPPAAPPEVVEPMHLFGDAPDAGADAGADAGPTVAGADGGPGDGGPSDGGPSDGGAGDGGAGDGGAGDAGSVRPVRAQRFEEGKP